MLYRMVKCPETGEPEMIEHDEHPLGVLIRGCSRFRPACQLGCSRSCARTVDQRARSIDPRPDDPLEIDLDLT